MVLRLESFLISFTHLSKVNIRITELVSAIGERGVFVSLRADNSQITLSSCQNNGVLSTDVNCPLGFDDKLSIINWKLHLRVCGRLIVRFTVHVSCLRRHLLTKRLTVIRKRKDRQRRAERKNELWTWDELLRENCVCNTVGVTRQSFYFGPQIHIHITSQELSSLAMSYFRKLVDLYHFAHFPFLEKVKIQLRKKKLQLKCREICFPYYENLFNCFARLLWWIHAKVWREAIQHLSLFLMNVT